MRAQARFEVWGDGPRLEEDDSDLILLRRIRPAAQWQTGEAFIRLSRQGAAATTLAPRQPMPKVRVFDKSAETPAGKGLYVHSSTTQA